MTRVFIVARQIRRAVLFKMLVAFLVIQPHQDGLPQDPGQGVGKQESQLQCGPMGSVSSDTEMSDDATSPAMTDLETKLPRYSDSLATLQV